jgi:hypothetical protein
MRVRRRPLTAVLPGRQQSLLCIQLEFTGFIVNADARFSHGLESGGFRKHQVLSRESSGAGGILRAPLNCSADQKENRHVDRLATPILDPGFDTHETGLMAAASSEFAAAMGQKLAE